MSNFADSLAQGSSRVFSARGVIAYVAEDGSRISGEDYLKLWLDARLAAEEEAASDERDD